MSTTENSIVEEQEEPQFYRTDSRERLERRKTTDAYKRVSRLNPTATCTLATPRPSALTSALPKSMAAFATSVSMIPTP